MTAGYKYDDIDLIIDTSTSYPGYFQLVSKKDLFQPVDVDLIFERWMRKWADSPIYKTTGRSGPSMAAEHRTLREPSMDRVPTARCNSWPLNARAWQTRFTKTGWPPQSLKNDICSRKCHFVFKAHRSSRNPSSECRFSFIDGESKLMSTLSLEQKRCFVTFKMLVKYVLSPDSAISSYCLKTTLFWTLETVPSDVWEDPVHGMAIGFLQLLDKLIHFLIGHCIPQYFIPENNLIECVEKFERRSTLRKLTKLRNTPVKTALEHDRKYNITSVLLLQCELSVLFPETVNHYKISKCAHTTVEECLKVQSNETAKYFLYTLKTMQSTRAALGVLKSLQSYDVLAGRKKRDLVQFVYDVLPEASDIDEQILIATLCSMVFVKGIDDVDSETRSKQQSTVDKAFEQILSVTLPDITGIVPYVIFLIHCRELLPAIDWLRRGLWVISAFTTRLSSKILAELCSETALRFVYLNDMTDVLDDILQMLIQDEPFINISAPSLAYYLLVDLYAKLNMMEQATAVTAEFDRFCHSTLPESRIEKGLNGYSLLAFSFIKTGDYWSAERAFQTHAQHMADTEYESKTSQERVTRLAIERSDVCKVLAVYSVYMSRK